MNLYGLLSLCASAVSISLGVSVYFLNKRTKVNRLFMFAMIANSYWAFCEYMLTQADSPQTALLWSKVLSFWPFLVALLMHFTLAFTESDLLKNKLTYLSLYLPALMFSLIDLGTDIISQTPTLQAWGYQSNYTDSVVSTLYGVWAAVLGLLVLFLFVNYYTRIVDTTRKKQTLFIAAGLAIPIFLSLIADSLLQSMSFNLPVLGCISGSISAFFILYAMSKHGLFSFRAEIAAENIFSTMPDSIMLVNLDGVIVKVNPSLIELSGYRESELLGKPISELVRKARVLSQENALPQIMAQLKQVRELRNLEITFDVKSGQHKTGMLSCSVVSDNSGHDVGAAFVLHDITCRKEMEQKLLKAERLASIGELAGILGHDLRNPLSGIRGASYYLKRKYEGILDKEDRAMFESIDKSINYSNKIINDLIDYSSEINLDLNLTSPKALINEALALLVPPQNIKVIDQSRETPKFWVDEQKIIQGFTNIITNAFDAMPNGGKLAVTSEEIGESIVISFNDTGQGMTQETLSQVWTPLFTTKAKGMGFGLAICKRAVEAHCGKVTAQSKVGEGTTIKVELPLKPKP